MDSERLKHVEAQKEALQEQFQDALIQLYEQEIEKVFAWFKDKFPKRTLQWASGMGTCFWILDGEILDIELDPRIGKLQPLVNFYESINNVTHTDGWMVDIGDKK